MEIDVAEEELEDEDDGAWLDEEGITEEISEADDPCDCSVMDEEVEDSTELDSSRLEGSLRLVAAVDEVSLCLWLVD